MPVALFRRHTLRRAGAVLVLGGCVTGVSWLQSMVVGTPRGQQVDQEIEQRVLQVVGDHPDAAYALLAATSVSSVLAALAVLVVVALVRRRPVLALGAAVVVLGSSATTAGLKIVLGGSLPSGHTTAVAGLACAAILVAPPAARLVLALLGAAATLVEGTATMVVGWHHPADLLAAALVVAGWTALVVALARSRL